MEQGPNGATWNECAQLLDELCDERHVTALVRIDRPFRLGVSGRRSSWCIVLELFDRENDGRRLKGFRRPWGGGGSVKTAPQALYWAMWDAHGWLDEKEGRAAE